MAIEARLYAEDPEHGFLPSTGKSGRCACRRPGVRVDAGVEEGGEVTPLYDPMIAKLIAHAPTRDEALATCPMRWRAPSSSGRETNVAFLERAAQRARLRAGAVDTGLIDAQLGARAAPSRAKPTGARFSPAPRRGSRRPPALRSHEGWPRPRSLERLPTASN